jgi:hypothetical protein
MNDTAEADASTNDTDIADLFTGKKPRKRQRQLLAGYSNALLAEAITRSDTLRDAWEMLSIVERLQLAFKEAALEWLERHRDTVIEQVAQVLAKRI